MSESLLKLPKGKQSYENIVKNNFYYVDKTRALKTVFEDESSQVLLITRPRRFGKSLTLSMFNSFLSLNYEDEKDLSHHIELFCFYCSLASQRASWMCPFFTQVSVWLSNFYQGACALSKKYIIVMVRR